MTIRILAFHFIALGALALAAACGSGSSGSGGGTLREQAREQVRALLTSVVSQGKTIAGQQCGDGSDTETIPGGALVLSEIGPDQTTAQYSNGAYDETRVVALALSSHVAYFHQWHSWPNGENGPVSRMSIVDNANAADLMASPDVITLDELTGR